MGAKERRGGRCVTGPFFFDVPLLGIRVFSCVSEQSPPSYLRTLLRFSFCEFGGQLKQYSALDMSGSETSQDSSLPHLPESYVLPTREEEVRGVLSKGDIEEWSWRAERGIRFVLCFGEQIPFC